MVVSRLVELCGTAGLRLRVLDGPWQAELTAWHGDLVGTSVIDPTVPVLVLGDLGFFGTAADRACWRRTARRLRRQAVRLAALVPCPIRRWDRPLARAWNAMPWERSSTSAHGTSERRAGALLRLLAPTALVQPGLVRALRRLLPAIEADASTEVDVWRHADVQAADVHGLVLKTEASARWREQFAKEVEPRLQADVSRLIQRWHGNWRAELIHAETIAWMALRSIAHEIADPPGRPAEAEAFAAKVAATLDGDDAASAMAMHYSRHMTGALPDQAYADIPALATVWSLAYEGVAGARLPSTIDPGKRPVRWRPGPRLWTVRQRGDLLVLFPAAADGSWTDREPGSPVATLTAAVPEIWVQRGQDARPTRSLLEPGTTIALAAGERIRLRSDCGEVTLGVWEREPWAVAVGRDCFGLWAAFEVEGVQQRMRWIPPGRFLMGSHESEAGRFDDEGPQHWVTLTKGYWLGDTPVTQALWRVVMGENPSTFRSDDRPVEQVSWDDCEKFIGQLNRRLDGLFIRLPTEAEWERACRAGTTAATWIGDLMLQTERDAPELDAIAWYRTNSGVDFELGNAVDLSNSTGQHHTRAGTHPVGRKLANPYGLHDMLGNIFEWCQDAADNPLGDRYTSNAVEDPVSPNRGSFRIYRGASWRHDAILVRAASRDGNARGYRNDNLGLRLVADHEPAPSKLPATQSAEQHKRAPRGRRATEPRWVSAPTSPSITPPPHSAASARTVLPSPSGVVVTRPAVIVGAPARPGVIPRIRKAGEHEGRGFGQGLVSEMSLDDVILAYLSEDADDK